MQPLVEKSAAIGPAKNAGMNNGFQKLGDVLKNKSASGSEFSEHLDKASSHRAVKLQTVEKDGVIEKIKIRCSCGETIEIDCRYDA